MCGNHNVVVTLTLADEVPRRTSHIFDAMFGLTDVPWQGIWEDWRGV